jgi:hypothetical protein
MMVKVCDFVCDGCCLLKVEIMVVMVDGYGVYVKELEVVVVVIWFNNNGGLATIAQVL